jgi:beta-glucosidase
VLVSGIPVGNVRILVLAAWVAACAPQAVPEAPADPGPAAAAERTAGRAALPAAPALAPAVDGAYPVPLPPAVAGTPDPVMEAFIDSILDLMTLEEKVGQLTQGQGRFGATGPAVEERGADEVRAGRVGSYLNMFGAERLGDLQRMAVEESRLGIPVLFAFDVIHGFRTVFPVPLAEAATWDAGLVERSARIAAVEATAHGLHWTYAPMVDVARDARWGRIVEGSGEDPWLGSVMAAARVRGFQGDDLADSTTVIATAKHFVAYGAAEAGRDYNPADISERTLHEVYLPPFYAAVEAGAQSIMGAFNEVAGVPMHAHEELLTDVLRDHWGFRGVVVSDYTAIREMLEHGIGATDEDVGVAALRGGTDVDMLSEIFLEDIPPAVESGRIDEALVDRAVRRVLRAKYWLGLFDDPYRYHHAGREQSDVLTPAHREFAREIGRESIVLLKNDGVLPFSKELGTIAVIGSLANSARDALGNWVIAGRAEDAVSVVDGIREAVPGAEVVYEPGVAEFGGAGAFPTAQDPANFGAPFADTTGFADAVSAAEAADAVVLVLGETQGMSAEASSRTAIDLPGEQVELARRILATGTPTAIVLMNGRPLAIPWVADNAPAIVEAWFLGSEMGPAVADVVFGDHNPSGKLPVTFPRTTGQVPIYYAHRNTGRPPNAENHFTSKYLDAPWTPQFAFGHGLSYTTFEYDGPRLSRSTVPAGDSLTVEATVTNTGDRAGQEVVQLYVRDDVGSVTRPVRELRGYHKVSLEPGQSETVRFTVTPADLAFYDLNMVRVVEPGTFTVFVGGSSAATDSATFTVEPAP